MVRRAELESDGLGVKVAIASPARASAAVSLSKCFGAEPGQDFWHGGARSGPGDRPLGDAFQCFVVEGEHEMASPAPLAFIEAFMSAIHFHQLGDPGRILNLMCAVEFQPAAPEGVPAEYLVVRGADLDARHPLELHDTNTVIRPRVSHARVGSVEERIVDTQVEGHKGPQTR